MMDERIMWLRGVVFGGGAAVGTALVWLLGGWDDPLIILIVLMSLDYIAGLWQAAMEGKLNSARGWRGIAKKGAYFLVVIVAHFIDHLTGFEVPLARTFVVAALSINESLSVLEHAGALGVPIPKALIDRIEKLRQFTDSAFTNSGGSNASPT